MAVSKVVADAVRPLLSLETREEQRAELPAELREEAVLISCGADLLKAMDAA